MIDKSQFQNVIKQFEQKKVKEKQEAVNFDALRRRSIFWRRMDLKHGFIFGKN